MIENADDKGTHLLHRMTAQMEILTQLIASFVNVYKIQNGKLQFKKTNFAIGELIESITSDFQTTATSHTIIYTDSSKSKVYADRERIGQVLVNLISNSIKYSPKGNKIIINSRSTVGKVTVSVKDFGMGIPKAKQKRIFERFFRVKAKKESNISGLGLGLYISNEIIMQHRGKIWVEPLTVKAPHFFSPYL